MGNSLLLVVLSSMSFAQSPSRIDLWAKDRVEYAKLVANTPNAQDPVSTAISSNVALDAFALLLLEGRRASSLDAEKAMIDSLWALAEANLDKQIGSASPNAAGTSLAMKGAAPKILGLAVESGALQRDTSGTIVTFRTTPTMLLKVLRAQSVAALVSSTAAVPEGGKKPFCAICDKVSLFASFDTNRGGVTNTLLANSRQLNSFGGRVEFINQRRTNTKSHYQKYQDLLERDLSDQTRVYGNLRKALAKDPVFTNWLNELKTFAEQRFDKCASSSNCFDFPTTGTKELQDHLSAKANELLKMNRPGFPGG
jgi:hypothetical protein